MKVNIQQLIPNPANPRVIKDSQFKSLVTSLLVFPEMLSFRPLVVNKKNEVLGGNQRLRALLAISQMEESEIRSRIENSSDGKKMGKKKINECVSFWVSFVDSPSVEVNVVDWNDHQQRQFIIKDNATFGEWDWDALANEWDNNELIEWGVPVWNPEEKGYQEYEDDEEMFPDTGVESNLVQKDSVKFGRHRIFMTKEEAELLEEKLMEYINRYQNTIGFFNWLINGDD